MADPLAIIGTVASVAGIIEVLAKTVSTLHKLHSRWKQADFIFINLVAQLTALKAALTRLEEWMSTGLTERQNPHHQLVMDLEVSITCCRMLTHKMDAEISELYRNTENVLDAQSKVKLMVKNGTLEELQKIVERQTGALTLLLTVYNWWESILLEHMAFVGED
jgi:guanine nucleotide-binding protein G(i) subunit alpha